MGNASLKRGKAAASDGRVQELEAELQAERNGNAELRDKVVDLEERCKAREEEARVQRQEFEKLKKQGSDVQAFLKSFSSIFAGSIPPSIGGDKQ